MSCWELFRACGECGAPYGNACRTPADQVAPLPCSGRQTRPGADPTVVRRWKAQRKRRAALEGLLPGSPAAAARVADLVDAADDAGRNDPGFTRSP